jgi:hypothetical protein
MVEFLLGFYVCGALLTFMTCLSGVILGGKSEELWIPFVCGAFWLFIFIYALAQMMRR